jgi:hypothetical protein
MTRIHRKTALVAAVLMAMPDVSFFSECLQRSFEDLKDAAKCQS